MSLSERWRGGAEGLHVSVHGGVIYIYTTKGKGEMILEEKKKICAREEREEKKKDPPPPSLLLTIFLQSNDSNSIWYDGGRGG